MKTRHNQSPPGHTASRGQMQKPAGFKPPSVAPPVYRPQPTPKVLQRKPAQPSRSNALSPHRPVAPTFKRPEIKRIAPPKMAQGRPPAIQPKMNQARPSAPPVYRPLAPAAQLKVASSRPVTAPIKPSAPPIIPRARAGMPARPNAGSTIQRVIDPSDLPTVTGLNREGILARMRKPPKKEEPGELATAWLKANLPAHVEKAHEQGLWEALIRDAGLLDDDVLDEEFLDDEVVVAKPVVAVAAAAVAAVAVVAPVVRVDGRVAATGIIKWLKDNGHGGDTNYTVGVLKDHNLIIAKVNGVTTKAKAMKGLGAEILSKGYHRGRNIYLAQKFNTGVGSNHAEMCILAAAGADNVSYMLCTGPHCPYCADTMDAYGVEKGNVVGGPGQQGWAHPFFKVSYGTQLSGTESAKRAELKKLNDGTLKEAAVAIGQKGISAPRGARTEWVFG